MLLLIFLLLLVHVDHEGAVLFEKMMNYKTEVLSNLIVFFDELPAFEWLLVKADDFETLDL